MSDTIKDGGPAFPIETTATPYAPGMTLRDWFAGQALAGCGEYWCERAIAPTARATSLGVNVQVARKCYEIADAMLAARSDSQ